MKQPIVFIHGMFENPKSWEGWSNWFTERGFECHAPAWPLHEGEPADLRRHPPAGLGELRLEDVVSAMRREAVRFVDPILIGHSLGGLVVQRLVNEGVGVAGVPICSVAPNRMLAADWGLLRNTAEITNPLMGDAPYPMDADGFHKNFANTMSRAQSDAAFETFAMDESRNVLRDILGDAGHVDLDVPHVPLLFIAAEKDEIIPAALCEKQAKGYTDASSVVDFRQFDHRGHFICGEPGWQEVAAHVLEWITARVPAASAVGMSEARPSPWHPPG